LLTYHETKWKKLSKLSNNAIHRLLLFWVNQRGFTKDDDSSKEAKLPSLSTKQGNITGLQIALYFQIQNGYS
jgi:hypothetical protein